MANVIGFQGIHRYRMGDEGAGFTAEEQEPIFSSTDPNFRPSDLEVGPDGAIYFLDWQNPIIGHMQHNLRDPSRDRTHGRVYRVTYEGRPLLKPARDCGRAHRAAARPAQRARRSSAVPRQDRAGSARYRPGSGCPEVMGRALNQSDIDYEHHLLEALWTHQFHDVVNVELLNRLLAAHDFRARAAATRVLCYWRDRVPDRPGAA